VTCYKTHLISKVVHLWLVSNGIKCFHTFYTFPPFTHVDKLLLKKQVDLEY